MNLMQLPDAKRQVSEEKREQRTKHNRFQIKGHGRAVEQMNQRKDYSQKR